MPKKKPVKKEFKKATDKQLEKFWEGRESRQDLPICWVNPTRNCPCNPNCFHQDCCIA